MQEPENCTVDDYERLADLDFGLMVWRQNLKRSTGLASTRQVCSCVKSLEQAFTVSAKHSR